MRQYRLSPSTIPFVVAIALTLIGVGAVVAQEDLEHLEYRSIGPAAGGRVSRVTGVDGDPLTYYAATASGGDCDST